MKYVCTGGLLVFLLLLARRLALEHPQHAVGENEAADDVSRRTHYRDKSEDRAHGGLVRACGEATESTESRSRCCSHRGCERDDGRYFAETVLRSSWTADPFCHPSAPGSIFASGMSARAAFLAATEIE